MTNDIIKRNDFPTEVVDENSKITISNQELLMHGCKNCVWKLYHQCPYNLTGEDEVETGICKEFTNFIFSLAKEGDSSSALWEKFHIYVSRMQLLVDFKKFKQYDNEIEELTNAGASKEEIQELEIKRNNYKLWWTKLHEQALKGLSRVVDREQKVANVVTPKLSIQQFNLLINKQNNND